MRVRQFFPETWVWEPMLITDDAGRATLSLTAPDNITSWRLAAIGTCPQPAAGSGGIGFGEAELTVFQDFFVEPSLPYSVTRGEEFPVKVDVFNYLETEEKGVYAVGDIYTGSSGTTAFGGNVAGSDTVSAGLRQARLDGEIKAIVLRVDSPGGSALASVIACCENFCASLSYRSAAYERASAENASAKSPSRLRS